MKIITTYDELITSIVNDKISMVNIDNFNLVLSNFNKINSIDGDIVECGCWRGGFSIFLSHVFSEKNIWVCDSFDGFQPINKAKYSYEKERHTPNYINTPLGSIKVSLEEVKLNFKNYELDNNKRINFLKGFVKDTLNPDVCEIKKISLLRIDVDSYSATLEVLDYLYDKVNENGYIIFDDSALYESLDAIKEFLKNKNLPFFIYHPVTNEKLDLNKKYTSDDSGFPSGCYIIKQPYTNNENILSNQQ